MNTVISKNLNKYPFRILGMIHLIIETYKENTFYCVEKFRGSSQATATSQMSS